VEASVTPAHLKLISQLAAKIFQRRPTRIFDWLSTGTALNILIRPAMRTKSLTILAAKYFQRDGQQNLLTDRIFKQQTFPLIIADLGFGAGYRKLFPPGIRTQWPI
jgi:hypothetical protein